MSIFKWLRRLVFLVLGLAALGMALIAAVLLFEIPVDAALVKPGLEQAATLALGRKVAFNGELKVVTSLSPAIEVADVTIANEPGFKEKNLARLKFARLHINALKLLTARLQIHELTVQGIELNLESRKDGSVNWDLGSGKPASPEPAAASNRTKRFSIDLNLTGDSLDIRKITLTDIAARTIGPDGTREYRIDQCIGSGKAGKTAVLDFKGAWNAHPYTLTVELGSLAEFLSTRRAWTDISAEIAKTRVTASGSLTLPLAVGEADLKMSVQGDELNSLNTLIGVDLPPFRKYMAACALTARKGEVRMEELDLRVGSSRLTGTAAVDNRKSVPEVDVSLTAEKIQLDDFKLHGWTPTHGSDPVSDGPHNATGNKEPGINIEIDAGNATATPLHLLSPEFLRSLNARLSVAAEDVKAGKADLGSGKWVTTLRDGVLRIDPLDLHIPGGSVHFDADFTVREKGIKAGIRTRIDRFDSSILVKRVQPDSNMGGLLSLDVNLNSDAEDFDSIMDHANGYFRIAARPENIRSGIIDMWAVNLFAAVMSNADKSKSQINCAVLRLNIKDGVMTSETLMADTTRMRIYGAARVDFKKQTVDVEASPSAKRAEFFSLATPVAVHGTFKDFGVKINPFDLFETVISFITSPVHVPIRRLVEQKLPADGSDVCIMDFDKQESVPGLMHDPPRKREPRPRKDPLQGLVPRP